MSNALMLSGLGFGYFNPYVILGSKQFLLLVKPAKAEMSTFFLKATLLNI